MQGKLPVLKKLFYLLSQFTVRSRRIEIIASKFKVCEAVNL